VPPNPNGVPVFDTVGGVGTSSPERITYRATWITRLISEAYGIRSDDITGPAWLSTDRYDIIANIPPGATKIQPVYALRVGKDGPKFKPTRRTADATVPSGGSITVDADGCSILPPDRQGAVGRAMTGGMCWTAQDVAADRIANGDGRRFENTSAW
jgi:hypothetical protein